MFTFSYELTQVFWTTGFLVCGTCTNGLSRLSLQLNRFAATRDKVG